MFPEPTVDLDENPVSFPALAREPSPARPLFVVDMASQLQTDWTRSIVTKELIDEVNGSYVMGASQSERHFTALPVTPTLTRANICCVYAQSIRVAAPLVPVY